MKIAITLGDPAGIGAEVILKALAAPGMASLAEWVIVGDRSVLEQTAEICGGQDLGKLPATLVDLHCWPSGSPVPFGQLDAACGAAAVEYVRAATEMCLRGETAAMVTAPLNKEAVTLSGRSFSGHTEYIAELCGATEPRMLLAGPRFSVIHVSTHIALRRACELQQDRVLETIRLGNQAARMLGHPSPRIVVCGLNPHAGEHGLFGTEDEQFILPAVQAARGEGILCSGPAAPDTVFLHAANGHYDLVVAMYHDQGHIPMKLLAFEDTVNVSVGIPIIRTSVDHGTAFDIAGRNVAGARNMEAAMRLAAQMASSRLPAVEERAG
ncbi:MAG TPA: 4-hydroxythreonine-4-phosphate dehydrogenase PdxA [Acidobacteriaceae bacterium]|nr:4-hydroxythreonine-4-phosphate dehydrogenase PdxA [Acidobacteriaceae bacterium]